MLNGDKEYYKVVIDLLKNIITALFVAELGLIGYFFTNNNEYTIYGIGIVFICLIFVGIIFFNIDENLRD